MAQQPLLPHVPTNLATFHVERLSLAIASTEGMQSWKARTKPVQNIQKGMQEDDESCAVEGPGPPGAIKIRFSAAGQT